MLASSLRSRYSSYRSLSRSEPSQPLLAPNSSENPFDITPYPSTASSSTAIASFPFASRTTTTVTGGMQRDEEKLGSATIRRIVVKVVHPRRTRSQRKAKKVEIRRREEEERVKEIEDFLESGRGGPRRYL